MSAAPIEVRSPLTKAVYGTSRRGAWIGAALIAGLVCFVYRPAMNGGLVLDDDQLVTQNQLVHAPDGLYRMWFSFEPTDYWPVTSTTFWLEWRLWGDKPTGYHVVNIALHVIECLLLWQILRRLKISGAFLAAIIFAVHPVNVESVAWIAQLKNVLAMLFYLLSVLWYLKGEELPTQLNRWYWLSLFGFVLAMLSKGSVAILPVVLLLLIWWRRPLVQRDYTKAAPFFVVAGILTVVNIWFQTHGAEVVLRKVTAIDRLLGAGGVIWFYLYKALLPIELNFFYPQWQINAGNVLWWLPLIAAIVVTAFLWWQRRSVWGRPFFVAWLYFCVCLLPVMGFTDVGYMRFSLVADHYQHLAIIGVIVLVATTWSWWRNRSLTGHTLFLPLMAAVAIVALLSWLTLRQCELYRSVDALYQSSLSYSWGAHTYLGRENALRGQLEQGIEHFQQALRLNPEAEAAETGMALALIRLGRMDEALVHARRGVDLRPDGSEAHNVLGIALKRSGHLSEAMREYQEAIRIENKSASAYNNLGIVLEELGRDDEAIENYQKALKLNPFYAEAHNNLGLVLLKKGRLDEAITHYREAVHLNPDLLEARKDLGTALLSANRASEAVEQLERFVSAVPGEASVWAALVVAYDETGRTGDAVAAAEKGLSLAQSQNQTALIQQLESWLADHRGKKSPAPKTSDSH